MSHMQVKDYQTHLVTWKCGELRQHVWAAPDNNLYLKLALPIT
jgi:hypothetical protein